MILILGQRFAPLGGVGGGGGEPEKNLKNANPKKIRISKKEGRCLCLSAKDKR